MRSVACALVMAIAVATQAAGAAGQASTGTPAQTGAKPEPAAPAAARRSPGGGPVIVFDTAKGAFEVETFPNEAPKTVALVLDLVKRNYYNGLRVHRYEPGMLVQFGDPQTRDMTKKADWGLRGSGNPVGVTEVSPKRPHRIGAVGAAWARDPRSFDGQIYVVTSAQPQLNSRYTVWGQVISGMDVVEKLRVPDVIKRASVKQSAAK
jgi:peptidyl-prolyl cis-trans isomerase B (cyclophilin B)